MVIVQAVPGVAEGPTETVTLREPDWPGFRLRELSTMESQEVQAEGMDVVVEAVERVLPGFVKENAM